MTDPLVVEKLLLDLNGFMVRLLRYEMRPFDDFDDDEDLYSAMERVLEMATQCAIDLACHIISDGNLREPDSYADAFASLREAGILAKDLASSLQNMAKFRNLLVHMYAKINHKSVYEMLQPSLDDLRAYADAIRAYLQA